MNKYYKEKMNEEIKKIKNKYKSAHKLLKKLERLEDDECVQKNEEVANFFDELKDCVSGLTDDEDFEIEQTKEYYMEQEEMDNLHIPF